MSTTTCCVAAVEDAWGMMEPSKGVRKRGTEGRRRAGSRANATISERWKIQEPVEYEVEECGAVKWPRNECSEASREVKNCCL
jgi:hypothetical protein